MSRVSLAGRAGPARFSAGVGGPAGVVVGLCVLLVLCGGARAASAVSMQVARSAAETPLAPVCSGSPDGTFTNGTRSCFPQQNGNQAQNGSGQSNAEIAGATLSGPSYLETGPCPPGYPRGAWCTKPFTLSVSVPGEGAAKYFGGWGITGISLAGAGTVPRETSCGVAGGTHCPVSEQLVYANNPARMHGQVPATEWCTSVLSNGPDAQCAWKGASSPLRIWGNGAFSTMMVCAAGLESLETATLNHESFTACIQIQLGSSASAPTPTPHPSLELSVVSPVLDLEKGSFQVGESADVRVTVTAHGSDFNDIFLTNGGLVIAASCGTHKHVLTITSVASAANGFSLTDGASRKLVYQVTGHAEGWDTLEVSVRGEALSDGRILRSYAESEGIWVGPIGSSLSHAGPKVEICAARSTSARSANETSPYDDKIPMPFWGYW